MPFELVGPPSGKPHLQYRCVQVTAAEPLTGWVISSPHGLYTHQVGKITKPCRHLLSGGKLHCPCQDGGKPPVWKAYLPLLTKKKRRVTVIISKTTALEHQFIKLGDAVRVHKGTGKTDRVMVEILNDAYLKNEFESFWGTRAAVDVRRYLLHLWGDEELTAVLTGDAPTAPPPAVGKPGRPRKKATPVAEPTTAGKRVRSS